MTEAVKSSQNDAGHCRLCRAPILVKRRRGNISIYCSTQHKDAHWKAMRGFGPALFAAGRLIVDLQEDGGCAVHALAEPAQVSGCANGKLL